MDKNNKNNNSVKDAKEAGVNVVKVDETPLTPDELILTNITQLEEALDVLKSDTGAEGKKHELNMRIADISLNMAKIDYDTAPGIDRVRFNELKAIKDDLIAERDGLSNLAQVARIKAIQALFMQMDDEFIYNTHRYGESKRITHSMVAERTLNKTRARLTINWYDKAETKKV